MSLQRPSLYSDENQYVNLIIPYKCEYKTNAFVSIRDETETCKPQQVLVTLAQWFKTNDDVS